MDAWLHITLGMICGRLSLDWSRRWNMTPAVLKEDDEREHHARRRSWRNRRPSSGQRADTGTTFAILVSLSVCHMLNDLNQSLVPALYPILKTSYQLDFAQIGLITLAFQLTASMLQPVVGMVTDRRPQPFSLPIAMSCSLVGLLLLSVAN